MSKIADPAKSYLVNCRICKKEFKAYFNQHKRITCSEVCSKQLPLKVKPTKIKIGPVIESESDRIKYKFNLPDISCIFCGKNIEWTNERRRRKTAKMRNLGYKNSQTKGHFCNPTCSNNYRNALAMREAIGCD